MATTKYVYCPMLLHLGLGLRHMQWMLSLGEYFVKM